MRIAGSGLAPGRTDAVSHEALLAHCELNGDRVCICDPPNVNNTELLKTVELAPIPAPTAAKPPKGTDATSTPDEKPAPTVPSGARPRISIGGYGACYFPWIYGNDALDTKGIKSAGGCSTFRAYCWRMGAHRWIAWCTQSAGEYYCRWCSQSYVIALPTLNREN